MGKTIFFSTAGIGRVHDGDPRYAGDGRSGAEDAGHGGPLGDRLYDALRVSPFSSFTAEWIMFTGIFERGLLGGPFGLVIAVGD